MPKIYFYDTGIVCSLLGIKDKNQVKTHYLFGSLFETILMAELQKYIHNYGIDNNMWYFRDKTGNEIDCILETKEGLKQIEIKASQTVKEEHFASLKYWDRIAKNKKDVSLYLLYGGLENQKRTGLTVFGWKDLSKVFVDRKTKK